MKTTWMIVMATFLFSTGVHARKWVHLETLITCDQIDKAGQTLSLGIVEIEPSKFELQMAFDDADDGNILLNKWPVTKQGDDIASSVWTNEPSGVKLIIEKTTGNIRANMNTLPEKYYGTFKESGFDCSLNSFIHSL